jgi:hypothetical protein
MITVNSAATTGLMDARRVIRLIQLSNADNTTTFFALPATTGVDGKVKLHEVLLRPCAVRIAFGLFASQKRGPLATFQIATVDGIRLISSEGFDHANVWVDGGKDAESPCHVTAIAFGEIEPSRLRACLKSGLP